jgi:eukaryotic-like serine/threonine-protein kinase
MGAAGPRERIRSDAPLVLHRYRLRRRLGDGGFATVWLARDERLDREVAIKILPRERVAGGRFEREARAAARLSHPAIVTLYEAAVDDEGAYLVSELVHGGTLDRLLEQGRLSDRDLIGIGIALCDALAHAHAHGVIHRDVKPSNVLIPDQPTSPAGLARLTDFGVARVLGGDTLTLTGDVIGTAAYMAPEQAKGLPAGAAADLFSLALVLYEGLTGLNPVRSGMTSQGARRMGAHLPPLRRQRRELPRELGQAIDLALRPRPSERGRLEELRGALTAVAGRVGDEPGVVADAWRLRTPARGRPDEHERWGGDRRIRIEDRRTKTVERRAKTTQDREAQIAGDAAEEKTHIPWPRRAAAAVAAAALAAWLAGHAPGSSPLPAPATATAAAVLVAALPRGGWLALTAFMATCLIIRAHAGTALLLVTAAAVPALLIPRDGPAWPLPAAAPALGAIGLAGAWPAVAGLSGPAWRRGALAASGWLWLALARGPGTTSSLSATIDQVLVPLLTVGTLAGAGVWAAAAIALPWLRARGSPIVEAALLAGWAAALGLATAVAQAGVSDPRISPAAAILGGSAGAFVSFVTRHIQRRLAAARWAKYCAPTA